MDDRDATTIDRLEADDLLRVVGQLPPGSVTLTGWPGSGHSLVTELLGEQVHEGKLPVEWNTPVLIVMYESLTDEGVEMLERLGVDAPRATVRSLRIGEALVLRRG